MAAFKRRPTIDQQGRPSDKAQQAVGAPVDEELRLLVVPARVRMGLKTSEKKSAPPIAITTCRWVAMNP